MASSMPHQTTIPPGSHRSGGQVSGPLPQRPRGLPRAACGRGTAVASPAPVIGRPTTSRSAPSASACSAVADPGLVVPARRRRPGRTPGVISAMPGPTSRAYRGDLQRGADQGPRAALDGEHRQPADGVQRRARRSRRRPAARADSEVRTVTPATIVVGQRLDGGPDHVRPAAGVHGEVVRRELGDRPGGAGDGVGDVVQLEVEEDVPAAAGLAARSATASRPVPQEELEADLDRAHVRAGGRAPSRRRSRGRARRGRRRRARGSGVIGRWAPPASRLGGRWACPTASAGAKPRAARACVSSRRTRTGARRVAEDRGADRDGADAPARTSSSASRPVRTPPMPRIGTSGQRRVHLPDAAHRDRLDRPGRTARR